MGTGLKRIYKQEDRMVLLIEAAVICFILVFGFLKFQMDDEVYYNIYDFTEIPEAVDGLNGVITVKPEYGLPEGTLMARMPEVHLEGRTNYAVQVDHQGDVEIRALVFDGEKEICEAVLPEEELNTVFSFRAEEDLYHCRVDFLYPGSGTATIKHAYLRADPYFHSDTVFVCFLLILLVLGTGEYVRRTGFLKKSWREKWIPCAVFCFAVWLCYPHYASFMPTGPDMSFHISRIEAIHNELLRGQFPVQLYTDALHGRGMIGSLYPSVFLYIPAFFRILKVSAPLSYNVFVCLINLITMAGAWHCGKRLTGRDTGAFTAMILYCTMLYRVYSLYHREALGEVLAAAFIPLCIAGLYDVLLGDRRGWRILSLGYAGLMGSHTLSMLFWSGIAVLFGLLHVRTLFREKRAVPVLKAVFLTLLLSAGTLVPFLYYHRSDINLYGTMASMDFSNAALYPAQLFMTLSAGGGYRFDKGLEHGFYREGSVSLGITVFLSLGIVLFCLLDRIRLSFLSETEEKNCREEDGRACSFAFLLSLTGTAFVFMSTTLFPWGTLQKFKGINDVVQMFQFPARFNLAGEAMLLMAGITLLFRLLSGKNRNILAVFLCAAGIFSMSLVTDAALISRDKNVFPLTADIEDNFPADYIPTGYDGDRFPEGPVPVSSGAEIRSFELSHGEAVFSYTASEETGVDLPLTFYEGYRAVFSNGESRPASKGEYGMTRISVPEAREEVLCRVRYEAPGYFLVSAVLSVLTAAALLVERLLRSRRRNSGGQD